MFFLLPKTRLKGGLLCMAALASACFFEKSTVFREIALAQNSQVNPNRLIDRVSLAIKGSLASAEEKQKFASGEKNLEQFIDEMVQTDGFVEEFSSYWLTRLGITNATDFENVNPGVGSVLGDLTMGSGTSNSKSLIFVTQTVSGVSYGFYTLVGRTIASFQTSNLTAEARAAEETLNSQRDCRLRARPYTVATNVPTLPGASRTIPAVAPSTLVDVQPWWNPSSTLKACAAVRDFCGNDLSGCFPQTGVSNDGRFAEPGFSYGANLRKDITAEPGVLIARIVQDGRPWDDVVRSTDGVITGTLEDFLASNWGARIMLAMPPGSYKNGTESLLQRKDPTVRTWRFIPKGSLHAGVLTTIAFQKAYNGWRAKSNAALSAFMCRQFSVPEGTAIVPSEESDLTRRPYCSSCHSVLEPLSQFYGRWPNLGSTNYVYNPSAAVTANGSFEGMTDADTNGLGRVLSNTVDFEECAVRTTFQFLAGREMTTNESAAYLADWSKTYRESGKRIVPLMKKIANSKVYRGTSGEK